MNSTTLAPRARRAALPVALTAVAALSLTACAGSSAGTSSDSDAEATPAISFQGPWYPNAQSGGWYAAETEGLFEDAGLDVTLLPGGPEIQAVSLLTTGQVDLASMTAEEYLLAREEGVPLIAVAASFDVSPTGVMVKESTGWTDWTDLAGQTWAVYLGSLGYQAVAYEYGIEFDTQASTGIAAFLEADDLVQQAYPTNETYLALKEGVETTFFPYYTAGAVAHADLVVATEDYLADNGDTVSAFLEAGYQGWSDYISDVDVATETHELLKGENEQLVDDVLWYAWDKQREYIIGENTTVFGDMSEERWQDFIDLLLDLDILSESVDAADVFTTDYLADIPMWDLAELPAAPEGSYVGQE